MEVDIENTSDDKVELSTEALDRIREFRTTLDETNMVSRSDVLAVEDFIGVGSITKRYNPNKLSSHKSSVGVFDLSRTLDDILEENKKEELLITYDDLANIVHRTEYAVKDLISRFKALTVTDTTLLDRIDNEKYIYNYNDQNELYDMTQTYFITALKYRETFIKDVFNKTITQDGLRFLDGIDENHIFVLFSAIKTKGLEHIYYSKNINIDTFTIKDLVNMIRASGTIAEELKKGILKTINYDLEDLRENRKWLAPNKTDAHKLYNRYKHILSIVKDDNSLRVLEVLKDLLH